MQLNLVSSKVWPEKLARNSALKEIPINPKKTNARPFVHHGQGYYTELLGHILKPEVPSKQLIHPRSVWSVWLGRFRAKTFLGTTLSKTSWSASVLSSLLISNTPPQIQHSTFIDILLLLLLLLFTSLGYPNVCSIGTHTHTHKHFGFYACMEGKLHTLLMCTVCLWKEANCLHVLPAKHCSKPHHFPSKKIFLL